MAHHDQRADAAIEQRADAVIGGGCLIAVVFRTKGLSVALVAVASMLIEQDTDATPVHQLGPTDGVMEIEHLLRPRHEVASDGDVGHASGVEALDKRRIGDVAREGHLSP